MMTGRVDIPRNSECVASGAGHQQDPGDVPDGMMVSTAYLIETNCSKLVSLLANGRKARGATGRGMGNPRFEVQVPKRSVELGDLTCRLPEPKASGATPISRPVQPSVKSFFQDVGTGKLMMSSQSGMSIYKVWADDLQIQSLSCGQDSAIGKPCSAILSGVSGKRGSPVAKGWK